MNASFLQLFCLRKPYYVLFGGQWFKLGVFDLVPQLQPKQISELNLNALLERCENAICLGVEVQIHI